MKAEGALPLDAEARLRFFTRMEAMMGLAAELIETVEFAPNACVELAPKLSPPSPEEGLRLTRDFLRIERTDLREKVFEFVALILSAQKRG